MLEEKNICTGCGACAASCPLNCIEMLADQEGFRYPVMDATRCSSCHKCEAVCPVLNKLPVHAEPQAYGVKHKDVSIRSASSSGGVFPALASFVLVNGGAVCGAAYADDFSVEHLLITDISEINKLQGAKYVQSRTEHLFSEILRILEANRWLLFVGTPCQVVGLRAYLGKNYDKLILVDMICHGVPSPKVWEKYLQERNGIDAKDSAVAAVNFRSKESGWSQYSYSIEVNYTNGIKYTMPQGQDLFMQGFIKNLYLRPSCANCGNKGMQRCSDITLGDFWGIWDLAPDFDDNKGVSLLLLHTNAGLGAWKKVCCDFDVQIVESEAAIAHNPSALTSSLHHPMRQVFFENIETEQATTLIQRCLYPETKKVSLIRRVWKRICR